MSIYVKIISAVLSLLTGLCSMHTQSEKCKPEITGSFIQPWLSEYFDDEDWDREIREMKDDGLKYLIIQSTAEKESGKWTVYFNSDCDEFKDAVFDGNDVIEKALRACQKNGVKVFVGLAVYDNWWLQGGRTREYADTCRLMADMVEEIYDSFGEKYSDTLCGFYFTPEIGSSIVCTSSIKQISEGINIIIDRMNKICPELPLMLSPFMFENSNLYSVTSILPMWIKFFEYTAFRDGDIFCPQDSIGVNTEKLKNAEKMWLMYSTAVKTCEKNVKLWANCENFISGKSSQKGAGMLFNENTQTVTATLDRFTKQLKAASQYGENIVSFSYNHHYSSYRNNSVFADTYNDYVKHGFTLENQPPCAVSYLTVVRDGIAQRLSWIAAEDNIGIAYYRITVNGRFLGRVEATADGTETEYYDDVIRLPNSVYTVTAFDGAGNASKSTEVKLK